MHTRGVGGLTLHAARAHPGMHLAAGAGRGGSRGLQLPACPVLGPPPVSGSQGQWVQSQSLPLRGLWAGGREQGRLGPRTPGFFPAGGRGELGCPGSLPCGFQLLKRKEGTSPPGLSGPAAGAAESVSEGLTCSLLWGTAATYNRGAWGGHLPVPRCNLLWGGTAACNTTWGGVSH